MVHIDNVLLTTDQVFYDGFL